MTFEIQDIRNLDTWCCLGFTHMNGSNQQNGLVFGGVSYHGELLQLLRST